MKKQLLLLSLALLITNTETAVKKNPYRKSARKSTKRRTVRKSTRPTSMKRKASGSNKKKKIVLKDFIYAKYKSNTKHTQNQWKLRKSYETAKGKQRKNKGKRSNPKVTALKQTASDNLYTAKIAKEKDDWIVETTYAVNLKKVRTPQEKKAEMKKASDGLYKNDLKHAVAKKKIREEYILKRIEI